LREENEMTKKELEQKIKLQQETIETMWGMVCYTEYEVKRLKAELKESKKSKQPREEATIETI